jgi:hypothetical protein
MPSKLSQEQWLKRAKVALLGLAYNGALGSGSV